MARRAFEEWQIELHGRRAVYRIAGSGPPVVLIHGMVNSSRHWEMVARRLARDYTVVAPDLIGHGDSETPRTDYSLGAHAAAIRDLMVAIGIERATIVGHSVGGGVALQFFYQFPQHAERLVLVSSGGLGPEVRPLLRSVAVPGFGGVLALASKRRVVDGVASAGRRLRERGKRSGSTLEAAAWVLRPLESADERTAFIHTLRGVIDVRGQKVSARDRLYLLESVPTLVVWGERDNTIPIEHGIATHRAIPHSRFETLPRAGHFPHLEDSRGLAAVLHDFLQTTDPAPLDESDWAERLARAAPRSRLDAAAAPPA
jgi:pimeloyl-ACP methyl ester carboxylesterase